MNIRIRIARNDLRKGSRILRKLARLIEPLGEEGARKLAKTIARHAKRYAPVSHWALTSQPGRLRRSIQARRLKSGAWVVYASAYTRPRGPGDERHVGQPYAWFQEVGVRARVAKRGFMIFKVLHPKGRPAMRKRRGKVEVAYYTWIKARHVSPVRGRRYMEKAVRWTRDHIEEIIGPDLDKLLFDSARA